MKYGIEQESLIKALHTNNINFIENPGDGALWS